MTTTTASRTSVSASRFRRDAKDKGYVLALVALLMLPLMGFTGFAVDLGSWYAKGTSLQAASDAAALAGVVYLPDEDDALAAAQASLANNGIVHGQDGYVVSFDADIGRQTLKVTLRQNDVEQYFSKLFVEDPYVQRQGVAQFVEPVPMGSPESFLGKDPERYEESSYQQFVLNLGARGNRKENGDKRQAGRCENAHVGCDGNFSGYNNADYSPDGYFYGVRVDSPRSAPLSIEVFDPAFAFEGDACTWGKPTGSQLSALDSQYGGDERAMQRYGSGRGQFCVGDQRIGEDGDLPNATYIVRAPDDTPFLYTDNPVICTITFDGYRTNIYNLLNTGGSYAGIGNQEPRGREQEPFYRHYKRWFPVCTVPAGQVQTGEYIVQMRTNADLSDVRKRVVASGVMSAPGTVVDVADPLPTTQGYNRLMLRSSWGQAPATSTPGANPERPESGPSAYDGDGLAISALGNLPIYQSSADAQSEFYLARIPPANAGRSLLLTFFDIADVGGGTSQVQVLPPPGVAPDCTFRLETDLGGIQPVPTPTSGCSITNMTNALYNGRNVTARIPIPGSYTCDMNVRTDCWFRIRITINGATPADTTTWSATMEGDPVRLIE